MTRKVRNLTQVIQMAEDADGKIKFGGQFPMDISARVAAWTEAEGLEVVGDGVANGTTVVSLSIATLTKFACMSISGSTNISAVIAIASGTLASHTDIYHIDLQNAGGFVAVTENTPIFVYNNSTAAAVTLLMLVPQTAMGAATNNDANHYFNGYMGGILI
ncbi:hypothetical protein LCGC14_0223770 [marine sediment metagenome]|uniref:Uncharacterized protein n=1 Tax=marine sediment metagenome TaxID=412755 RepID=A0A0F9UGM3_9ZZZZ